MRRCKDEKIRYRPPVLVAPCAQTLSGKSGVIQKTLKNTTLSRLDSTHIPLPIHSSIYMPHLTPHIPFFTLAILLSSHSILHTFHSTLYTYSTHYRPHSTPYTLHSSLHFFSLFSIKKITVRKFYYEKKKKSKKKYLPIFLC
jgi:hypothetical protein